MTARSITRRDFLNGALLGCGGALLALGSPLEVFAASKSGEAGDYASSAGNTDAVIADGHLIRDRRSAELAALAKNTGETFDLVVIGGGISGLTAAHSFTKETGRKRSCLVLENHPIFGGVAKRNEFVVDGYRLTGPQGSNSFVVADRPGIPGHELYRELNIPEHFSYLPKSESVRRLDFDRTNYGFMLWFDSESTGYFFDAPSGGTEARWERGIWLERLKKAPLPGAVQRDLLRWREAELRIPDGSDLLEWLDSMTYGQYLEQRLGLSPGVGRYADPIMASALGLGCDAVSAYGAYQVSMPGFRSEPVPRRLGESTWHSFPGGNDGFVRYLVKALVPEAIAGGTGIEDILDGNVRFSTLDRPGQPVCVRLKATTLHVAQEESKGMLAISYVKDGAYHKVRARRVVMACGSWTARRIVQDLPEDYRKAFSSLHRSPFAVINVALTNWRFLERLGITACRWFKGFGFSCNLRQPMAVGKNRPPLSPDKPALLTFYVPYMYPGLPAAEQGRRGRFEMLATSFAEYEKRLRTQMTTLFGAAGFDPARDIAGIVVNRWGHAMVNPGPGFYTGGKGGKAARDILRQRLGPVSFAHAELNGHQHWAAAADEGRRAALQMVQGL